MINKKNQWLMLKLFPSCLFALILLSLIVNCSEQKPPSVGVFLKNPGEDYVRLKEYKAYKLKQGFKETMAMETSPIDKNGKIVFYGVDLDFSNIYVGFDVYPVKDSWTGKYTGLTGKLTDSAIPVIKSSDDLFSLNFKELWSILEKNEAKIVKSNEPGLLFICYKTSEYYPKGWFFSYTRSE